MARMVDLKKRSPEAFIAYLEGYQAALKQAANLARSVSSTNPQGEILAGSIDALNAINEMVLESAIKIRERKKS